MTEVYSFFEGTRPLLISVPHDGRNLPEAMIERMTPAGLDIPDTDWHVARLYDFAKSMGASMIVANYSRYVVDLNRSENDDDLYPGLTRTGLCPARTFAGGAIYKDDSSITDAETATRVDNYWRPYHAQVRHCLDGMKARYGYALLWDAHSIPSVVPRLFEGVLPELNIGTDANRSCLAHVADNLSAVADSSSYKSVANGRFKGGHITRHYGQPDDRFMAVQLEIAQRAYMDESSREFDDQKADKLRATLTKMIARYLETAAKRYT